MPPNSQPANPKHGSQPNVGCNPKRRHDRDKTNRKMKDKMPTLQQNQKSYNQLHKVNALQHILFCPNVPKPIHHSDGWTVILTVSAH